MHLDEQYLLEAQIENKSNSFRYDIVGFHHIVLRIKCQPIGSIYSVPLIISCDRHQCH